MRFDNWIYTLRHKLPSLIRRDRLNAEMNEELQTQFHRQIGQNIALDMHEEKARRAAAPAFGSLTMLHDQTPATRSWGDLEVLLRDVRLGARTLMRTPGFAAIAILVVTLGIGANVALFAIVRSVLLNPLPFADSSHLLRFNEKISAGGLNTPYGAIAGGVYAQWKERNQTLADIALTGSSDYSLSAGGAQLPEVVHAGNFSWNMLPLLGVHPALGRGFTADDDKPSADPTVLLSWGLWKRRFGGDPGVLNKTILLDGVPHTVVGVMPPSSGLTTLSSRTVQLWTPIYEAKRPELMKMLDEHEFAAIGRLRPGVAESQAVGDLTLISSRIHDEHPDDPFIGFAASARPLLDSIIGKMKAPLYTLLAATGCVLLIACLNVANLLVARAASRRKEQAIRTALGGSKLRLLSQHFMESLLICVAGGILGVFVAMGAVRWFVTVRHDVPRADSIAVTGPVVAFAFGLVIVCAAFAAAISFVSTRGDENLIALRETSRGQSAGVERTRLRSVLLSLEVGLTVVLLIGAGLLLKSYAQLRATDLGCLTRSVLKMDISLPDARYKGSVAASDLFSSLLARISDYPGIKNVGIISPVVPGDGSGTDDNFVILEHPALPPGKTNVADNRWCDPGYFAALGIPVLKGRNFSSNQRSGRSSEILISESFARRYFVGEDPIGKHMTTFNQMGSQIVGIVGDTRTGPGEAAHPTMYFPILAASGIIRTASLVIRSNGDVTKFGLPIQRILAGVDGSLAVSDVLTMEQVLGRATLEASFDATLLLIFAGLSLVLAAVGLFGVLSFVVAQRTAEIGIRMALGASRAQIVRLTVFGGLKPVIVGLVLGLVASSLTGKVIGALLFGTHPFDPGVFFTVSATMIAVALVACAVPAWRASRLDPVNAIRTE